MKHAIVSLFAAALLAATATAQDPHGFDPHAGHAHGPGEVHADAPPAWNDDHLDVLGSLPIQEGGRVKPLSTHAGFALLRLSGRRTMEGPDGAKLAPEAFLMEALVDPEASATRELFLVAEGAAIDAIGLDGSKKKRRARWSFEELRPAIPRLFELAHEWGRIEAGARTATQQQTVQLAEAVDQFLDLAGFLDFARVELPVARDSRLAALLGVDSGRARFSQLVAAAPKVGDLYRELSTSDDPLLREELRALDGILRLTAELGRAADGLALVPPAGSVDDDPVWRAPGSILTAALDGQPASDVELEALRGFEALAVATDVAAYDAALARLTESTRREALRRGEAGALDLERNYYKAKPLTWAAMAFVLAFVAATITWLRPRARAPYIACSSLTWIGLALLVAAITVRCVIRGRPPVSTLYETVLFVTATGTLLALVTELIDRRRIAVSAAAGLGMVGLFLAAGYEKLDAADTMPELVAVLDTNFWLATHVTTITIGYAAGMLAALLGSAYVVMRLFRARSTAPDTFRALARMVYGTICFGLLFSLVGTILGGLWANDSWGRFWGWDPKENGALLICLTMTAILHGRMGGHLKELGICVAAAFGGTVVAFSWWGVNLLGVGLHSYGFTSGIARALWTYYGLQWFVCALGGVVWWKARIEARVRRELQALPAEPETRAAA